MYSVVELAEEIFEMPRFVSQEYLLLWPTSAGFPIYLLVVRIRDDISGSIGGLLWHESIAVGVVQHSMRYRDKAEIAPSILFDKFILSHLVCQSSRWSGYASKFGLRPNGRSREHFVIKPGVKLLGCKHLTAQVLQLSHQELCFDVWMHIQDLGAV